jgi:hypothetical protein
MSQIDSELEIIRQKLALLEEQKKQEQIELEAKKAFYESNPNTILISLPKYSNEDLLQLKAKKEEEKRIMIITEFIKMVHKDVIQYAETHSETKYEHMIGQLNNLLQVTNEFYITNKIEIICNLQYLFPKCDIKYVTLDKIVDHRLIYNIDNLPRHLEHLKNNKQYLEQNTKKIDYLIIDWS